MEPARVHIAEAGVFGYTETLYGFNRIVPYTGTTALWRFRPPRCFDVNLKAQFDITGEMTISGLCTEAEKDAIDDYLAQQLSFIRAALTSTAEVVEMHNDVVRRSVTDYVRTHPTAIKRIREGAA